MKYTYLLVNLFAVLIPFVFSFHPKIRFNRHFTAYFAANFLAAIPFLVWDMAFTRNGFWGFNNQYTMGIYLHNLPLEEVLFFLCIPFACLFTYHSIGKFYHIRWNTRYEHIIVSALSAGLLVTGLVFISKPYTAATFISTGLLLLILKFVFEVSWLPRLLTIYLVLLLPFFIVNGILTGTGLQEPVVWYNNATNLGIRLGTIPVEDIFYGLELIVLTTFFYEEFRSYSAKIRFIQDKIPLA